MNAPRQNRTFICSVLFLDIVEYSRKPVATQIRVKERLNSLLTEALHDVAQNDRIILDTGDGVALNFIGNPEDALFVSMSLRDDLAADTSPDAAELKLRSGINLGPVRLVKDINGRPNIIGDGINVAQRIMSFAEPGQILVSRSYHEVISSLSESYGALFRYQGSHTDKHVRAHEVYEVGLNLPAGVERLPPEGTAGALRRQAMRNGAASLTETVKFRVSAHPWMSAVLVIAIILGLAFGVRTMRAGAPDGASSSLVPAVAGTPKAPATAVTPAGATGTHGNAAATGSPPLAAAAKAPETPKDTPSPRVTTAPPAVAAVKAAVPVAPVAPPSPPPAVQTRAPAAAPQVPSTAGALGTVNLAVSPWGEVYVNGALQGVSPPLRELKLAAGQYRIEIRNPASSQYAETIRLNAGGTASVQHKFE